MLAEAVSINGGTLLLILLFLVAMVVVWCALVVFGCRLAKQAGQGSRQALVGWAVVGVLELAPLVVGFTPLLLVGVAVLGLQAAFYLRAKAESRPGDGS